MKKTLILLLSAFILVSSSLALADVPTAMQFQGFLTDAEGKPLNGVLSVTFTLYGSADGADSVWTQVQDVALEEGTFTVILGGSENPLDTGVFTGDQPLWLGVTVGGGEELTPRSPISSVPYATHAAVADNAMTNNQVQSIIDDGGYLTEFTETDPMVNALAKTVLNCGMGEVAKWDGEAWVCAEDNDANTTYSGSDFALSDQTCPAGQKVAGVSSSGGIVCEADVDTQNTYSGADFALSDQLCPAGQYARGFNGQGEVWCYNDANTTYSGADFALSNQDCPAGMVVSGLSASGAVQCEDDGGITDAHANLDTEGRLDFTEDDDLVTKGQADGNYAPADTATLAADTATLAADTATLAARMRQTPGYQIIQSGAFLMGSPSGELGRSSDETQHWVTVSYRFEMKMTEVTQAEFEDLMGYNPSYFSDSGSGATCGPDCPVEYICWHEALAYANAKSVAEGFAECFDCTGTAPNFSCDLKSAYTKPQDCPGYRLPTEAEWEYAARAGTTTAFYSGDITSTESDPNMDAIGWYYYNSDTGAGRMPHPVGQKQPNLWGLKDMSGNVKDWVWDKYCEDNTGYGDDPDGSTCGGSDRVVRGGNWGNGAQNCRSADRNSYAPGNRDYDLGARLSRSLP